MSQQNVAVIQGAYEAFARGDVAAVLAAMDPAIVWNEAENFPYADRNPYIGLAAVGDGLFRRIAEDWDHFEVAVEEILDGGDRVVALGRYRSAHKTTGARLNAQFAHVWWLRGGKIIRFQQYADTAQTLAATGAIATVR